MDTIRFDEDVPEHLQHLLHSTDTDFVLADGTRFLELVKVAQ
jgi:hypothetical protein